MELVALGVSYRTAGVELREKASLSGEAGSQLLRLLARDPAVAEAVALSTCNRTEIYAWAHSLRQGRRAIADALIRATRIQPHELEHARYVLAGHSAVHHLLRVAASLDSMVVGESEIQGQVRSALAFAQQHGTAGPRLRELFRRALVTGKRVRRETAVGRGAVSVSSAAVDLASEVVSDLADTRALLVGAGRMAEATARALLGRGLSELVVVNRSPEAATSLAARFQGRGAGLEALEAELARADIVISSTDSPWPLLDVALVRRALAGRDPHRMLLIDIAVPRDVDPAVRALPGVLLRDIDDLERVVRANLSGRQREAQRAERIVLEELHRDEQRRRDGARFPQAA